MLKGDYVNLDNPLRLPDAWIISFLREIPEAKASFLRLFGTMTPDEQDRLSQLIGGDTMVPELDEKAHEDAFQHAFNVRGVRTAGPYGGYGYG